MRQPVSPIFTKFFKTVSESDKTLYLEQIQTFFKNIDGGSSEVKTLECGLRFSSILEDRTLYGFSVERYNSLEDWYVKFHNTAIPYAEIEMSSCAPRPEHIMSIDMDYTQLLIEQSLADVAWGYDYTWKTFIDLIDLLIGISSRSSYIGKIAWVYLMLKIRYFPELERQFEENVYPKVPIYDFGNYLENEALFSGEQVMRIKADNTKDFAQFIHKTDCLILNAVGENQMREWLNRIGIDFDTWFKYS